MSRIISIIAFIVLLLLLLILFKQCSPRQEITQQSDNIINPIVSEGIIHRPENPKAQIPPPSQELDQKTPNTPKANNKISSGPIRKIEKSTALITTKVKDPKKTSPSEAVANAAKKAQENLEKVTQQNTKQEAYIILQGVNFKFGSATLSPEASIQLKKIVKRLKKKPELKIEIAGYADNTEDSGINKNISQLRSEAVKDYIVSNDIKADRLIAKGYSSNAPIANNADAEGRKQNRRVEIHIKL